MRVLEILPYFFPAWAYGGPVYFVNEIAKRLAKKKHKVTVFASDVKDARGRLDIKTGIPIKRSGFTTYYFRNLSNWAAWNLRFFHSPEMLTTGADLMSLFDIVHFHDFFIWQNYYLARVAKKNNIPIILQANSQFDPVRLRERKIFKTFFLKTVGSKFLNIVDHFIAVTEYERQCYIKLGIDSAKITVIPTGIETDGRYKKKRLEKFRKQYHIDPETQVILFLARIHRIKGIDLLIRAYKILKKKHNRQTKLLIVGPDNDNLMPDLSRLVSSLKLENDVVFTGGLTGEDKILAYKAAAVYVLPSFSEGLPSSVLEACSLGVPVAISENCHIPEVSKYRAGLIFKNSRKNIIDRILTILTDVGKVNYGKNGKRMVREVFCWDKIINKLEIFYRQQIKTGI